MCSARRGAVPSSRMPQVTAAMTTHRWSVLRSPTTPARSASCAALWRDSPHNRPHSVIRMRRRAMRTLRIFAAAAGGMALVASACGGGPAAQPPSGSASGAITQEVKVGVAISLTGAANVYGPSQQNGVNLAAEQINAIGRPFTVRLVIEDDASTAAQSITVFKKFIDQDKVAAILGPTLSGSAAGAHPGAQASGTPVIALSNTGVGIVGTCDYVPCAGIFRASPGEQGALPETAQDATHAGW